MSRVYSSVAGIILAAGLSKRFGSNKLLSAFGDEPLICKVLRTTLASRLRKIVLVLGHERERIGDLLGNLIDNKRVEVVLNSDYRKGQSSSVIAGLNAIHDDYTAAMFLLGDQPLLEANIIDQLISTYESSERNICLPACNDRRRNPVIFSANYFPAILALTGDTGARALIDANSEDTTSVEFTDERPFLDIDRVTDLHNLNRQ